MEEGRKQGFDDSKKACQEETGSIIAELTTVLTAFDDERIELISQAEADLLRLAISIAGKIVKKEVSVDE